MVCSVLCSIHSTGANAGAKHKRTNIIFAYSKLLKSFCVTSPFECRTSISLVIEMKSLCKHIPKLGDKHFFLFRSAYNGRKEALCLFKLKYLIGN